ncbi:hypothetical protein F0562_003650 [Nyssa sinensis]|uniref:Zinc/iron permease n=1 Tax=Nyssa sinensis TaxID=561372 RepID=A0A5J5BXX0_9ASTE|nr:hypothetical protein F0562_003650 [Nyssa sinensis]
MNSSITMNKGRKIQNVLFLGILVLLPSLVMGECTCELEEGDNNKHEALKYKGAAIASILVACAIGVCIPMLGKIIPALQPDKDLFFVIKAFAAGVILATGFVHVLPDAFDHLTSPCLSILNAASAGILIYMALVDLLAADFMNAKMQNNRKLQLEANVSLLLGAALMSLLAKWA